MTTQEQIVEMRKEMKLSCDKLADIIGINKTTVQSARHGNNVAATTKKAINRTYKAWKRGELDDAIKMAMIPKDVAKPTHFAIFETMEAEDNYILEQLVELIEKMGSKRYPDADDFQRHNAQRLRMLITSRADHSYYRSLLFPVVEPKPKAERKPRRKLLIGHDYRIASRIQQYGEYATVIGR